MVKSKHPAKSEVVCCDTCSAWVLLRVTDTARWHRNGSVVAARPIRVWPLVGTPAATASGVYQVAAPFEA